MKEPNGVGRMWNLYRTGGFTPAIASMLGSQNAQHMAQIRNMNREQRRTSALDATLDSLEVVVFDLETTGFSPNNGDEIISFGAVSVRGGKIIEEESFYSLVNPKRNIPLNISELTGISNEMVKDAPDLIQVLSSFMSFIGKRILVAHASGHDKQFLNQALWRTSKTNLNHRVIDTIMLAKWLEPGLPQYDLDTLLLRNEIPIANRHHALEDSIMTAKLWNKYMDKISLKKNIVTLGDVYAYLSQH
ncbi:MAG: exonuclease domain-containing protein [Candidatus Pristimantibacillus lignocellulolyticus]|uniref:Exonuclease domain-containing protein n=1 Tax=Candidatus Pristimantibacillus lignocellulolyticus TaxID=2994561 RepID=A0A9J6ZE11_9BACL|nr:MAG: exonuclease domain-containing protein [Candidatus Pristimantibacillus lignocellulolyticus]